MFEHIHKDILYWQGYTHFERHKAIHELTQIIDKRGFITDHHMFSDMEIAFTIAIPSGQLSALYKDLCSYMLMDEEVFETGGAERERTLLLHITFTHATGDMVIEVPAVPG